MKLSQSKASTHALLYEAALRLDDAGRPREGARILHNLAKAGDREAQFSLGVCYDYGRGVRRSITLAMHWYRLAARRGSAAAANNIANTYRALGRTKLAERWLLKAVRLGESSSLLDLAKLYLNSERSHGKATEALRRLLAVPASEMSEDTREQAEALLSEMSSVLSKRSHSSR